MSLFIGYTFNDIMIGFGTPIWNNSILILPYHDSLLKFCFLPFYIKDLPLLFCFIGIFYYSIIFYIDKIYNVKYFSIFYNLIYSCNKFTNNKYYLLISNVGYNAFYFNKFYNYLFITMYNIFYIVNVKYIDKGIFEYFGPFGLYILKKYILNKCYYFFFNNIYFSLFIKFFLLLNIFFLLYFYSITSIHFILLIIIYVIIDNKNIYNY
jgi:hypothetical protein